MDSIFIGSYCYLDMCFGYLEHIWPVTVEAIDGKNSLVTPGNYRLCLTATNLTFIPLWSSTQPEIVVPVCDKIYVVASLNYIVTVLYQTLL